MQIAGHDLRSPPNRPSDRGKRKHLLYEAASTGFRVCFLFAAAVRAVEGGSTSTSAEGLEESYPLW